MTISRENLTVDRFIKAVLVHFIRKHSTGLVRFKPLVSDQEIMSGMWHGVEFAGDTGDFSPEMVVSNLIVFRLENWLYKHGVINEDNPVAGGFGVTIDSGSGLPVAARKITPLTAFADMGKQVELVVSEADLGSFEDTGLPVMAVTPDDRLPLGLDYLWELASALELHEAELEIDNAEFPVVKMVNFMLYQFGSCHPGDSLMVVPHNSIPDGPIDQLVAVIQKSDGTVIPVLSMMYSLHHYIIPRLRVAAGIDPDASTPVENRITVDSPGGPLRLKIRFEKTEGYDAVIIVFDA